MEDLRNGIISWLKKKNIGNRLSNYIDSKSLQKAKAFTQQLIYEIEKILIEEIEKIDGKVPTRKQLRKYGIERHGIDKTEYFWKKRLIVTVKHNHINADGKRGSLLEINKTIPE